MAFAVTLNGRDFSNASSGFTYYEEPTLSPHTLTLTLTLTA